MRIPGIAARVGIVVRPAAGGIRTHVSVLAARLPERGFDPVIFAPQGFVLDAVASSTLRVDLNIGATLHLAHDLRTILDLSRMLRGKVDLVHAHGLRGALIGIPAARLANIPALFTAHNLVEGISRSAGIALREVGKRSARVIAVSEAVKSTLVAAGIAAAHIEVIPNGLDSSLYQRERSRIEARRELGIDDTAPLVAVIGRLSPEKGIDVAISAMRSLLRTTPNIRLAVAGDGPALADLVRESADLPEGAVLFLGRVDSPQSVYAAADVVIVPSRSEGQGLVAMEAMASARTVVASRVGGLEELIDDGVTGLFVPPDSASGLAEAVEELLADPSRAASMGIAARISVLDRYSETAMLDKTVDVYRACLEAAGR